MEHISQVPSTSIFSYLLLENPWILPMAMTVIAAVCGTFGWQYRRKWLTIIAMGSLLVAVAVFVTAKLVKTPREKLHESVEMLAEATLPPQNPQDAENLDQLLADDVKLVVNRAAYYRSKKELVDMINRLEGTYGLPSWSIRWVQAGVREDGMGIVYLNMSTRVDRGDSMMPSGGFNVSTAWMLEWIRNGDNKQIPWKLHKITWVSLEGKEPDKRYLP